MYICYVDESGCTGTLNTSNISPLIVIAGFSIKASRLKDFTRNFLALKRRFYPKLLPSSASFHDWILKEIKGSDLRKDACKSGKKRRHGFGVLDQFLKLLEQEDAKIFGRITTKQPEVSVNGRSLYTSTIQAVSDYFHNYLEQAQSDGSMILDSRWPSMNSAVAHSIFTKKFKAAGDAYPRLLEMPAFGHSENHAGIQAADLLCSGLLFPMAAATYCSSLTGNIHVRRGYINFRQTFGPRLKALQHRYRNPNPPQGQPARFTGGIVVNDTLGRQPGALLFRP